MHPAQVFLCFNKPKVTVQADDAYCTADIASLRIYKHGTSTAQKSAMHTCLCDQELVARHVYQLARTYPLLHKGTFAILLAAFVLVPE